MHLKPKIVGRRRSCGMNDDTREVVEKSSERCMRLVGWQGEVYAVGCRYTQYFPGLGGTPEDDMIRSSASPPGRWHLFRLPGPIHQRIMFFE